jgi:hypothetical protein
VTNDPFGKLKFKDRDESWAGIARFPLFAALGERPEPPPLTEDEARQNLADMSAALDAMKEQMRERFGDQIDKAFADIDQATENELKRIGEEPEEPDAEESARDAMRAARRAKRAAKLAEGKFPFRVAAPDEADPTPAQAATFAFLRDNEQLVLDAVRAAVWESFQNAFNDEYWRQISGVKPAASIDDLNDRFAVLRFDLTREARGGFAHLVFHIDSDWQDEHGNLVVFSPAARTAQWTTWDGLYDLLDSDEPDEDADRPQTPHEELMDAIWDGDEAKARELVAAGADTNALASDECPPLWVAVDQMEVELVRRLLEFGANPNLANTEERSTPLKHAKRMYRDMGFSPSKNADPMMASMMALMQQAAGPAMQEYKQRLEQIVSLLEAAGGKV